MISEGKVVGAIDEAEMHFIWCWEHFQKLRRHDIDLQDLFQFQVRLTRAFAKLDQTYRMIKAEQERLVGRKAHYRQSWFAARMRKLDLYLNAVKEALGIGRSLGDGFAWIFYRAEPELLDEHGNEQRQLLLPPSVGGIGEQAFIEKLQGVGGMFVLYHAITSFLRLGDVSFFNPATGEIDSIGELKTQHLGGDRYNITLGFVTGEADHTFLKQAKPGKVSPKPHPLDRSVQEKLDRQMDQLGRALGKRFSSEDDPRVVADSKFHFDVLQHVLCNSGPKLFAFEQAGPGLMLGAWHPRKQAGLGRRLLRMTGNVEAAISKAAEAVMPILDPLLEDNALFVSSLGSHETGFPVTLGGGVPLLWWPLEEQQTHDLLFCHVQVLTLYNPARLWAILRERGYEVIVGVRSRASKLVKKFGNKRLELENFRYFEQLAPYALMDENAVADMIDAWAEKAVAVAGDRPAKIGLRPHIMTGSGSRRRGKRHS